MTTNEVCKVCRSTIACYCTRLLPSPPVDDRTSPPAAVASPADRPAEDDLTRSKTFGKFSYLVDEVVYCAAMSGADDECGTCEDIGWHARLNGALTATDLAELDSCADEGDEPTRMLSADDRRWLSGGAGFIVQEDGNGFVAVERFETKEALREAWEGIQEADREAHACRSCGMGTVDESGTCEDCGEEN